MKTKPTNESVEGFLACVEDDERREDCWELREIMEDITGEEAKMWGTSIIGFGSYHYEYESGREGDWFLVGFSPRRQSISLYIMSGFPEYEGMLGDLGNCSTGKSCLYVQRLADIDKTALKKLIEASVSYMRETHDTGDKGHKRATGDKVDKDDKRAPGDKGAEGARGATGDLGALRSPGDNGAPILRD